MVTKGRWDQRRGLYLLFCFRWSDIVAQSHGEGSDPTSRDTAEAAV